MFMSRRDDLSREEQRTEMLAGLTKWASPHVASCAQSRVHRPETKGS